MDRVLVHWVALLVARCFPKEERGWSSELCNCGQQQSPIFRFVSVYQKKQKQKGKDHLITTRTEKNQVLPRAHALRYAIAAWEWLPGVCLLGWWVRPRKGAWFGPWGQRLKPTATLARTWARGVLPRHRCPHQPRRRSLPGRAPFHLAVHLWDLPISSCPPLRAESKPFRIFAPGQVEKK